MWPMGGLGYGLRSATFDLGTLMGSVDIGFAFPGIRCVLGTRLTGLPSSGARAEIGRGRLMRPPGAWLSGTQLLLSEDAILVVLHAAIRLRRPRIFNASPKPVLRAVGPDAERRNYGRDLSSAGTAALRLEPVGLQRGGR